MLRKSRLLDDERNWKTLSNHVYHKAICLITTVQFAIQARDVVSDNTVTSRDSRSHAYSRLHISKVKKQKKCMGHKNVINAPTEIYKHFLESS